MRFKSLARVLPFAFCWLLFFSCERKGDSVGNEKEIIVFADSSNYAALQTELSRAFEREISTPMPEKIFEMHWQPLAKLSHFVYKPRLVLLGTTEGQDAASQRIHDLLDEKQRARAARGESYLFKTDDPWRTQQCLLILTAPALDTLQQRIAAHREELFELFDAPLTERLRAQLYRRMEQTELNQKIRRDHGWSLRAPHDYFLFKNLPQENFLMLRRTAPERWLFVTWKHAADFRGINADSLIVWRNAIGRKFYENDRVAAAEFSSSETEFAGHRALQISGLWENEEKIGGGPFKAWSFYDEDSKRLFLIDIAVFAPGKEKVLPLRQLEIIARTFQLNE